MIYQIMSVGEKRSLSSSIKKHAESFSFQNHSSARELVASFYEAWLHDCLGKKLSWTTLGYQEQEGFKAEMLVRIEEALSKQIQNTAFSPKQVEKQQTAHAAIKRGRRSRSRRIGRNDSCLCGSGNKYKKCCLGALAAHA